MQKSSRCFSCFCVVLASCLVTFLVFFWRTADFGHMENFFAEYKNTGEGKVSWMTEQKEDEAINVAVEQNVTNNTLKKPTLAIKMKGYTIQSCGCVRFGYDINDLERIKKSSENEPWVLPSWFMRSYSHEGQSTCSDYATQRGSYQRVFSYSYYSPESPVSKNSVHFRKFLGMLFGRARYIQQTFPGWLMRVYHNASPTDMDPNEFLCKLYCAFDHVDICHVSNLPTLGNLQEKQPVGRMWRFAVMGDPTVEAFLSRDTDSWILPREVAAVNDWLRSGQSFHVIRDHPNHKAIVLAGLWGGFNKIPSEMASIRNSMFSKPSNLSRNFDQYLLAAMLWPVIKDDCLQHDSYNCKLAGHEGSQPFPTKREEYLYCGWGPFKTRERETVYRVKCPESCRPRDHPSWAWC